MNALLRKAVDQEYWRALCPDMSILDSYSPRRPNCAPLTSDQEAAAGKHLARHGYFQMPELTPIEVITRMHGSVEAVRAAGWPAVFTFVYDEFWSIFRTPPLAQFLNRQLGAGYVQTSPIWTYYVDPRKAASGWRPHVDSRLAERLTLWIPLTAATIGSGCIYVIPRDKVPDSLPDRFLDWSSVSRGELRVLLQNVTPLPASPGAVLGWNHSLIHWGGPARDPRSAPRISISVEFIKEGVTPKRRETPVIDTGLPNFATRLRAIGQAILAYEKFEPAMRRYSALANEIVSSTNPEGSERASERPMLS